MVVYKMNLNEKPRMTINKKFRFMGHDLLLGSEVKYVALDCIGRIVAHSLRPEFRRGVWPADPATWYTVKTIDPPKHFDFSSSLTEVVAWHG